MIQGSIVALVTPFARSGGLAVDVLRSLLRFHMESGTDAVLLGGTTGESPVLSHEEWRTLLATAVEECRQKMRVMAGCGANDTTKAVALTKEAASIGVSSALSVCPYYNKPPQEGLYRHFMKIADVGLPVVIYNVPGRTSVNIAPETVKRLSAHGNIVAIKEASGNIAQVQELAFLLEGSLAILSGDDALTFDVLCHGGKGVVSVTANIMPVWTKRVVDAALSGNIERARKLHYGLLPLHKGLFIETNPIPVKAAMEMRGWRVGEARPPLTAISPRGKASLRKLLAQYAHDLDEEHGAFTGEARSGRRAR
jgi:4-hydroxy-tetrahydrodipicolinate synthase